MHPFTLPPTPIGSDAEARWQWLVAVAREIERASQEDPAQIFDSYSSDVAPTVTRQVNVTSPSTANLAAVLATLIADWGARGVGRTGPT
jgi:hypothetical protein